MVSPFVASYVDMVAADAGTVADIAASAGRQSEMFDGSDLRI